MSAPHNPAGAEKHQLQERIGKRSVSCRASPKQSLRSESDDNNHREEQDDVSEIWEQSGSEGVNEPDKQTPNKSPNQAPYAAQHDHNEREWKHVFVKAGIGGENRSAKHPAHSCDTGPETKNSGEKP